MIYLKDFLCFACLSVYQDELVHRLQSNACRWRAEEKVEAQGRRRWRIGGSRDCEADQIETLAGRLLDME